MTEIERLQRELAGAEVAAYEAPEATRYAENQHANAIRAQLHAAIEAAKTPEQRQIEAMERETDRIARHVTRLEASLNGARNDNSALRHLIALHTGKPADKAIGLVALDLARIRQIEDQLAEAVRAGDLERAQRICINRGLPRAKPADWREELKQLGLIGRPA